MAVILNASTTAGLVTSADTSGDLNIQSGGSTKIAVTSSGVAVTGLSKSSLPTGSVLQVVNATYSTAQNITSTSFVNSLLTATITPTSATSKVLILFSLPLANPASGATYASIFRGTVSGTNLAGSAGFSAIYATAVIQSIGSGSYLDSPATTSSQTYTIGVRVSTGTGSYCASNDAGSITLMEIAA
jgi:hypothetical protein